MKKRCCVPMRTYIERYGKAAKYVVARRANGLSPHWDVAFKNIKHRCNNQNDKKWKYYGGRNIRCLITAAELRGAFIRDKAWKLKRPSVDRINNDGHYEPSNIRWIEQSENKKICSADPWITVSFRASDAQWGSVRERAALLNQSISSWVRRALEADLSSQSIPK